MIETTKQEKAKLKIAKNTFNSVRKNHPTVYNNLRDEMIRTLVKSNTPDWASVRFTITKAGV